MEIALPDELTYTKDGSTKTTKAIDLNCAPVNKEATRVQRRVKAAVFQISIEARPKMEAIRRLNVDDPEKEPGDKDDHKMSAALLYFADDDKREKAFAGFQKLFSIGGVCMVEDGVPLKETEFELTSLDNQETLIGAYIENFINT